MIYLDNAATSFPKPPAVWQAMERVLREQAGNPGRGAHAAAGGGQQLIHEIRTEVARFFGVRIPSRLVFTFNATDALNMAIKGWVRPGDHVVTTDLEHNSVLRPLYGLSDRCAVRVDVVPAVEGRVDAGRIREAITPATRLVVMTHASNVLGTVQPVADVASVCREQGVALLVDAAQSAGELPIDVEGMGIDMLAFPGHKSLLGPAGTGGLYVREGIELTPWREGGTGSESDRARQPETFPDRMEGGTQNLPGLAGLREGIRYLGNEGVKNVHSRAAGLLERLIDALQGDSRFVVHAADDLRDHVHVISLGIRGMDASEAGVVLDQAFGIAVRTGLHCAAPVHRAIGTFPGGTLRVSPGAFSTADDIDALAGALREIAASADG